MLKTLARQIPQIDRLVTSRDEMAGSLHDMTRSWDDVGRQARHLACDNDRLLKRTRELIDIRARLAARIEHLESVCAEHTTQLGTLRARIEELTRHSALDRPLAFMHVPKTSGSALTTGMCQALPGMHHVAGFDHTIFGGFRDFETMSEAVRSLVFETLPAADGVDFVTGHIAHSTIIRGRPEARLMTVLREPRSRVLSQWLYWRSRSDDSLKPWGTWGHVVALARLPLITFLNSPAAACHTDNVAVRMLLCPHPLIPDEGFIAGAHDARLSDEAAMRLQGFDFVDVVENPLLPDNLRAFLRRPFMYSRVNETVVPPQFQVDLDDELAAEGRLVIEQRSRLERQLWQTVAGRLIAAGDAAALGDQIFDRTVKRHAMLMRPISGSGQS